MLETSRQKLCSAVRAQGGPTLEQTVGEYRGIHCTGAGGADAFNGEPFVLEQAVKYAPGKGAMGTPALQCERDGLYGGLGAACVVCSGVGRHVSLPQCQIQPPFVASAVAVIEAEWSEARNTAKAAGSTTRTNSLRA